MSNDATVKFGYDGAALNAGLADAERRITRSAGGMERSMQRLGSKSGGLRGMGNVSMQIQDIAVQMQMGTKMSVIMAQQGSQMLSAFGPGGAILGGLLAVGGAFYTSKVKGEEMFQALRQESGDFDKSLRALSAGGITDMINGMDDMRKRAVELRKDLAAGSEDTTWNNVLNPLKKFFSSSTFDAETGKWTNQMDAETATKLELATKAEAGRKKLIEQIVTASADDLRVLELKAAGQADAADALEREIKLRRELVKLEAAPPEIRGQLQQNAIAAAAAEVQSAARAAREKAAAAQDELDKKRESIALSKMDVTMLEMQAKGQDRKLKKMQEQAFIEKRAHEFAAQGLDANASIKLAQREWDARENIEKRQRTGRSHIGGVSDGGKRMMTSGLDRFYRNQEHHETGIGDPARPGYSRGAYVPTHNAFDLAPLTSAQRGGRMMGGTIGPLAAPHRTTAGAQVQRTLAAAKTADAASKLDVTNAILTRGLLGS